MKKIIAIFSMAIFLAMSSFTCFAEEVSTYSVGVSGGQLVYQDDEGTVHTLGISNGGADHATLYLYEDDTYIYLMRDVSDSASKLHHNGSLLGTSISSINSQFKGFKFSKGSTSYGMTWTSIATVQAAVEDYIKAGGEVVQSDVFIVDSLDADLSTAADFFYFPLLRKVVVEQGALMMETRAVGAMKILVLCGVGCLALVIGYKILPRVLSIFLH